MTNHRCVKNTMAITAAALVAILFMQGSGVFFYTAMIGSALLVLMAIRSPWLGLLALFPLAFALRPAPPSAGAQEIAFAALMGMIFLSTLFKLLRAQGVRSTLRLFAAPILVGVGFLVLNLAVAMHHPVPLADWIRGAVPFVFIYALIPICALLGREESDIHWLGASVGSLILLTAGYIVLYYFYHGMWQPYWVLPADGEMVRISQEEALRNAQALGPMRGRITLMVAQATDAILPLGMVVGYVVCTLTPDRRVALISSFISLLCMAAVLITFTRSMLISALLVIGLFALYTFFAHKRLRLKVASSIGIQTLFGLAFIFATGMQDVWLGRLNSLAQTALPIATSSIESIGAKNTQPEELTSIFLESKPPEEKKDFNVSSRVEEYKIAWDMFLNHPVLGNGIGVKHEMHWERPNGDSFTESVGYIHNWPLYMLMVGGVVGLLIYAAVLAPPVLYRLTTLKAAPIYLAVIRTAVMTLAIYGLFFAVFRLISFNLLLAAAWGVMLAHKHSTQVMNIASPDEHNATPGTVVKDIQETSV
ncbi:ligase [Pseudomonas fluorescens]|uniref:O-antigen ligase family protein n=1 Tax=Pseudomonas lactucae TaxID=2813360 RepID=A0A9X1C2C5_9PSED|nr:O-antigen ligase family protein [Pseudomonas lactucae]MBN2988488.1 O-antigen ligase family protein [Pseudomonas lactucae]OPA95669.1 ligase [Pseudomonas fluorescens]OPB12993.1 ligase [Pseudomonas fluorescens]OPB25392.1 ligase [Pseudomonas fluorescens]